MILSVRTVCVCEGSARGFAQHHSQQLSRAAVCGDAQNINNAARNMRVARPAARLLRTTLVLALVATFCVGAVFATGLNKTTIMREAGAPVCMREASSVAEAAKCLSRARVS